MGMYLSMNQQRDRMKMNAQILVDKAESEEVRNVAKEWIDGFDQYESSKAAGEKLVKALENMTGENEETVEAAKVLLESKDQLTKKSVWIFGGDGWAYDIGYGGLDHVIASGANVNIMVFDTEIYSNTGGQASKSTPTGAVAQFAAAGKQTKKKDLGRMAMTYGNVYVAQVAMGANQAQFLKALLEAEAYDGPSIIIAYAPCISHGMRCGMANVQSEIKRAVEVGYWQLYRHNPMLKAEGKNPFILDSKEPTGDFREFLRGEVRFSSLERTFPEAADALFERTEAEARERYENYKALAQ